MPWEMKEAPTAQPVAAPPSTDSDVPLDDTGMPESPVEPEPEEGAPQEAAEEAAPAAEEVPPEDGEGGEDLEAEADKAVAEMLTSIGLTPTEEAGAFNSLQEATKEGGSAKDWQAAIDENFEIGPEGKPVLKLDAAARRIGLDKADRDTVESFDIKPIDEDAIVREAADEIKAFAQEHIAEEDMDNFLKASKDQVQKRAEEKLAIARNQQRDQILEVTTRCAKISGEFFKANPGAKKYTKQIDSWFAAFDTATASKMLIEFPGVLSRIYEAERLRAEVRPLLKKTWKDARSRQEGVPTDAGASRTGGRAPRGESMAETPEDDVRASILGAGRDSVLGKLTGG